MLNRPTFGGHINPLLSFLFLKVGGVKSAAVGDVCHCGNSSGWERRVFTISSSVGLFYFLYNLFVDYSSLNK